MDPNSPPSLFSPAMFPFWLVMSFIIGLLWGSFFNVCIYRIPMGLSPNRPRRSFCFSCGMGIAWYDNIPLLSWIVLRGRCRHCASRISSRYFIIELLTGLVFAWLWAITNGPDRIAEAGFSISVFWYWTVAGMLIVGAMTDIDHWIIPDGITRGGLVAALAAALVLPIFDANTLIARSGPFPAVRMARLSDPVEAIAAFLGKEPVREWRMPEPVLLYRREAPPPPTRQQPHADRSDAPRFFWFEPFLNALAGAMVGYAMLWGVALLGRLVFRREAMGGGDLKLFGFLGAVFGPFPVLLLLFLSSFVGVFLGGGAMLWSAIRPPRRAQISALRGKTGRETLTENPAAADASESLSPTGATPAAEADTDATSGPTSRNAVQSSPDAVSRDERQRKIIHDYLIYARKRPAERAFHHIPFGPSISLAAMLLLVFFEPIRRVLLRYLFPEF